jgi:hypothetical protein
MEVVNVSTSFGDPLSGLVAPLYFSFVLHYKFSGSLSSFLNAPGRPKHMFTAVQHASLILGYLQDFRMWASFPVDGGTALPGKLFFLQTKTRSVDFYWGGFGALAAPLTNQSSWKYAFYHFRLFFFGLKTHLNRVGRFRHSQLVHQLFSLIPRNLLVSHVTKEGALYHLKILLAVLVKRLASWPVVVPIPLALQLWPLFNSWAKR